MRIPRSTPLLSARWETPLTVVRREDADADADADVDAGTDEVRLLREYFSLVREGRTNHVATHSFQLVTGRQLLELPDFFKAHAAEMKPKRRRTSK